MSTDNNWIKIGDKSPPKDEKGMDWSIVVHIKVGKIQRKAYYDFFLQKWFWLKRDDTSRPVRPTHWRLPQPLNT